VRVRAGPVGYGRARVVEFSYYTPGTRRSGGQRIQWLDSVKDWAGESLPNLVTMAGNRRQYKAFVDSQAVNRTSAVSRRRSVVVLRREMPVVERSQSATDAPSPPPNSVHAHTQTTDLFYKQCRNTE